MEHGCKELLGLQSHPVRGPEGLLRWDLKPEIKLVLQTSVGRQCQAEAGSQGAGVA